MRKFLPLLLFPALLVGCRQEDGFTPESVEGYAPIYKTFAPAGELSLESTRATAAPGKIYAYGNYIFQVDQNSGVHVIDNTIPNQAKKIGYIPIPFCVDVAVKGGILYANNHRNLLAIDISNIQQPKIRQTLENAFPDQSTMYPQERGYFECVDPSKGIVVGWELKTLHKPKCQR